MNHRKLKGHKLGLTSDHRLALMKNLAISLIEHEEIKTTLAKAKCLRTFIEPMITKARDPKIEDGLHKARLIFNRLRSKKALKKIIEELAVRYKDRPGGYTRILKAGHRSGDGAPMAYIQLV